MTALQDIEAALQAGKEERGRALLETLYAEVEAQWEDPDTSYLR